LLVSEADLYIAKFVTYHDKVLELSSALKLAYRIIILALTI